MEIKFLNRSIFVALLLMGTHSVAIAYESESQDLANNIGATDFYQLTCPAKTAHADLQILDQSAIVQPAPQLLNFRLSKKNISTTEAQGVVATATAELTLQGGSGKYTITVDTKNTNLELKKAQSYRYEYQCLYTDGSSKAGTSSKKTIKNGTTAKPSSAKFSVNCSAKKNPATEVDKLYVKLTNVGVPTKLTASAQVLNAQLTRRDQYDPTNTQVYAANATDANGDDSYSEAIQVDGGRGDYFLTVNHTGTNAALDNAKLYSFRFNCLSDNNVDVGEPTVTLLQNQ